MLRGGEKMERRKEGKRKGISFHLFNHLSTIWHCWDAFLQLHCDE